MRVIVNATLQSLDVFSTDLQPAFGEAITEDGGQIGVKDMAS